MSLSENNSFEEANINVTLESDLDYLQIAVMVVDEKADEDECDGDVVEHDAIE